MHKLIIAILLSIFIISCEKKINFDLKHADELVVVDAGIENGLAPQVVLTHSLEYFGHIDTAIAESTFIHNAEVFISNGRVTHKLKERIVPVPPGVPASPDIKLYAYSIDSSDLATAFVGELNTAYTLRVVTNGKEYTATTTIPLLAKKPDSLWWKKAPYQEDTTRVIVTVRVTDPPGLGNYIRYFTKRNDQPFWPGENSVFDDQVIDGSTYELQILPGIDRNNRVLLKDNFFNRGDTVTFKLCNIDKATYTFWNTWEFAYQNIGNPFGQPNTVIGNISNGALGAFYGYGASFKTLVVPK